MNAGKIERGKITAVSGDTYTVESLDRPGVEGSGIIALDRETYQVGDRVHYVTFDDGTGWIACNIGTASSRVQKIFYQETAPEAGMLPGDTWIDIDSGNALYEYTSDMQWVLRQFGQGSIEESSITPVEMSVEQLSDVTANIGVITAGVLKSIDYTFDPADEPYSTTGMMLDLTNKILRMPKTAILADGSLYSTSVDLTGTITAEDGQIGPWTIATNGIRYNTEQSSKHALVYKDGIEFYDGSGYCSIWGANNTAYHAYFGDNQSNAHVWINSSTGNSSNVYTNINAGEISLAKPTSTQMMDLVNAVIHDYNASTYYGALTLSKLSGSTLVDTISLGGYDGSITANGTISAKKLHVDIGSTVAPIIENVYNSISYPLARSHNNGNISISASGGGLYLGWENTTGLYSTLVWTSTTTSAANVVVDGVGKLGRSTSSSKRYKHDIEALEDYKDILNIPVVSFVYNEDYLAETDVRFGKAIPGFIAEDVAEAYPIAAEWTADGQVEDWNPRYIIPPMLAVEQEHEKRIMELEKENERLRAEIAAIKKAIGIGE